MSQCGENNRLAATIWPHQVHSLINLASNFGVSCFIALHIFFGLSFTMTKRDSACAGIDSPRVPMQRRQFSLQFQNRSGAASSEDASSSATGHWPQHLNPSMGLTKLAHCLELTVLDMRQRPFPSLCHLNPLLITKGKHIHYNLRSSNDIECFIPISSKKSWETSRRVSRTVLW